MTFTNDRIEKIKGCYDILHTFLKLDRFSSTGSSSIILTDLTEEFQEEEIVRSKAQFNSGYFMPLVNGPPFKVNYGNILI